MEFLINFNMINKNSKVVASFKEIGATLVSLGKYESAEIKVKNAFNKDVNGKYAPEEVTTIRPMKTIKEAEYKSATRNVTLGYEFIEMALNLDENGKSRKPRPPKKGFERWLRSDEGKLFQIWDEATDEQKLQIQLEKLAHDTNTELLSFEILE